MRRQRIVALGAAAACALGAGVVVVSHANSEAEPSPSLYVPDSPVAPGAPTARAPRTTDGVSFLSPTASAIGAAAARQLPSGYSISVVRSLRGRTGHGTAAYEHADARGHRGDLYRISHFRRFAPDELDAQPDFVRGESPAGRYWITTDDDGLQAVTVLTAAGVAVRVDHFSVTPADRVAIPALLDLAWNTARDLAAGDPSSGAATAPT